MKIYYSIIFITKYIIVGESSSTCQHSFTGPPSSLNHQIYIIAGVSVDESIKSLKIFKNYFIDVNIRSWVSKFYLHL